MLARENRFCLLVVYPAVLQSRQEILRMTDGTSQRKKKRNQRRPCPLLAIKILAIGYANSDHRFMNRYLTILQEEVQTISSVLVALAITLTVRFFLDPTQMIDFIIMWALPFILLVFVHAPLRIIFEGTGAQRSADRGGGGTIVEELKPLVETIQSIRTIEHVIKVVEIIIRILIGYMVIVSTLAIVDPRTSIGLLTVWLIPVGLLIICALTLDEGKLRGN